MAKKIKAQPFPETWEQFCEQTGRDPLLLPDTSVYDERDKKRPVADFKLTHMIRHVNGEEIDYKNSGQRKFEIWWDVVEDESKPTGLGLSYDGYDYWITITGCGPRLSFLRLEDLKKAAECWLDLWEDMHL